MKRLLKLACATLVLASASTPVLAQSPGPMQSAPDRFRNANAQAIEADWARAPVAEAEVVTKGSVSAHGQTLRYTATAGTLTIRDDAGMPTASLFFTAYTLDGQPVGTRPVTYLYNGGPSSV